ncbi:PREDICTED: protransforming growth factor alpha-like [Branchiostoma belcheri]|uniref:Protransforming growth factor alpha-like n=1 Tax=Branchiostoma belcheri TaxID=7741 RepID=A0A6P5A5H9_BRABE|nr:PREDICTED: protransforming growth factor alpha-like [Branchiostoma belcheri]
MLTTSDQILLLALCLMPGTASRAERGDECPSEYNGFCLNGGICEYLQESANAMCLCPKRYWGPRCNHALVELESTGDDLATVPVAVIVGAIFVSLLIIMLIILLIICLRRYRRQRQQRQRQHVQLNGAHSVGLQRQLSVKMSPPLLIEYTTTV